MDLDSRVVGGVGVNTKPFLFVIGAGTAGNACARAVTRAGKSVVSAERDRVGGLCLWAGCMPKKALYNAARSVRLAQRMDEFGVMTDGVELDWPSVLAWKWHAQETYAGDQETVAREIGIEIVKGVARFTSPDAIEVDGVEFRPENVLIAAGSEPVKLRIPGADLADTTREALSYPTLPGSLAIIGAGFISLEFAGIFASFGTKVTVFMRGEQPLKQFDPDLVAVARTCLEELGVTFRSGVGVKGIDGEADVIACGQR